MRREERVTVQGPVKKQQPDGMSHRGGGGRSWGRALEQAVGSGTVVVRGGDVGKKDMGPGVWPAAQGRVVNPCQLSSTAFLLLPPTPPPVTASLPNTCVLTTIDFVKHRPLRGHRDHPLDPSFLEPPV